MCDHTFKSSEQQISIGPLKDPMLQGTALLFHLRASPHVYSASIVQVREFLIHSCEICLHCGVWYSVRWSVHQIDWNHPV